MYYHMHSKGGNFLWYETGDTFLNYEDAMEAGIREIERVRHDPNGEVYVWMDNKENYSLSFDGTMLMEWNFRKGFAINERYYREYKGEDIDETEWRWKQHD